MQVDEKNRPPAYAANNLDTWTGYFGFHSRASFCASAIWAGVILVAAWSRFLTARPHRAPG